MKIYLIISQVLYALSFVSWLAIWGLSFMSFDSGMNVYNVSFCSCDYFISGCGYTLLDFIVVV